MRPSLCRRLLASILLSSLLLGLDSVVPVAAQANTANTVVHEVAWGENLYRIALRYGVSVDAIVAANGLSASDHIYAGQRLLIPSASATSGPAAPLATHVVQPGENLFRIGLLYGLTTDALAQANGLSTASPLYVGQTLQIPGVGPPVSTVAPAAPPPVATHTVAPGENLFRIAQRYGVSVEALSAANALYNPGQIYAGQTLAIPGGAGTPSLGYSPAQVSTTHVVAPGETLAYISGQYGVAINTLMQVNNIANPSLLYAGQALTIPGGSALSSSAGTSGVAGKRIHVDLSEQRAYVYQDGQLLWTFVVSTGLSGSETWTGTFHVQNKLPMAYASTWNLQMPNWLGIYWAGSLQNGFHALPILPNGQRLWAGVLGRPISYGCIVLGVEDAARLYDWAEVGTEVTIAP